MQLFHTEYHGDSNSPTTTSFIRIITPSNGRLVVYETAMIRSMRIGGASFMRGWVKD